ncbi:intercellular adhesion molecule 2 isoform X1 [Mirounga angustirostris]|uniref:intercellular adhesion molecule 2 isoform X2 n=1 Tax=Mirounga leonina TaxID=9715 RepID=UPI00156C1D68|nr:intercellular adhesion molecule 2 isoform X2 [Mirounga leonina]XP_045744612.1 intercellular adhesion molecule 2 isoform X1 [Mirounga angustirostris]
MWSSAHRRLGFRATALGHHSLTWVHHLPPGGPQLFPVSLWMPLEMSPFGCWGLPAALLALFCCPGSGEGFEVHMYPEQLVVEPGGSKLINCSTSCAQPQTGGLETALTKTLLESGAQWKQYLVSNISQDTVIHCYFTCFGNQKLKSLNISVFYPPKQVLLKLQPAWVAVGRSFTVECHVPAVKPLESLTLTLLRGQEALCNKTFARGDSGTRGATATHNSTAHREDGHHNFSCHARLDLRSLGGGIVHRVSEPQMLKVYEPRPDNQMVVIISVVSVLLFLFVTSILLCFVLGQHWRQRRMGAYGVQDA